MELSKPLENDCKPVRKLTRGLESRKPYKVQVLLDINVFTSKDILYQIVELSSCLFGQSRYKLRTMELHK